MAFLNLLGDAISVFSKLPTRRQRCNGRVIDARACLRFNGPHRTMRGCIVANDKKRVERMLKLEKKSARKPKTPVRLPQRSEAVSGDEKKGLTPIAAAQKKQKTSLKKPATRRGGN